MWQDRQPQSEWPEGVILEPSDMERTCGKIALSKSEPMGMSHEARESTAGSLLIWIWFAAREWRSDQIK
jgi:hypothetical protein